MIKTVVGSYPVVKGKPDSIPDKIKKFFGKYDKYEYSIKKALDDQLNVGIDILSDGQVRGDMVEIFVSNMYGFEGRRVVNRVEFVKPITLNDIKYSLKYISKKDPEKGVKGIITGACTLASSIRVENYYSDNKDENLIYDLAGALNKEALSIQNHVKMIQFDEPILSTGLYDLEVAKKAMDIITSGINVPVAMHVCGDVSKIFYKLNEFNVDILDHEFASCRKNLEILNEITKKVGFGCINTKLKSVDSVDEVKALISEGIEILKNNSKFEGSINDSVIIDPDCGMRLLPVDVAYSKLNNMVTAANEIEKDLI
ncbi:methionine synthase [Methanococcus maripaludis]|uniref:5-methyltetrahydropteroyltriglutamate--homocystei ne S-methyltransferase n=1 Tax=Methanococcus maripaludis (strain DSM 14266 / JCM 13030 / NBRC 101832 / S2 / LL) TaxID=267377 RepID=Q6M070_METMP|nr:methionine synthase [Methanococcus maripaludis]CAF29957.1 5-methyltetrahydropteroyltriglutamate--homocysteine S-methyltransferase [Methanococcus maripaludis S2]